MTLANNLQNVKEKINQACEKSNRDSKEIKIIAVTKYGDANLTKEVLSIGLEHIGENRAQQAIAKYNELQGSGIWHFIGRLQSRKVKDIIGKFDYIHSLDRLSLAEEIEKRAKTLGISVKCFIQVNISGEESKTGICPDDLMSYIEEVKQFPSIEIVGLMTMAPHTDNKELTRSVFRKLKELKDTVNNEQILSYKINELSMGMSNDFDIAIEEGATFIRLGSILVR